MPHDDPADADLQRLKAIRAARARLNEAMRVMFARWGEARIAESEDQARAKNAVDEAETEFEAAREALEKIERAQAPDARAPAPDLATLRGALTRLAAALEQGEADPDAVFHDRPPGLAAARWEQEFAAGDVDVWVLEDAAGSVVAKITHSPDRPRWTVAVLNQATGELE